jgi:D-alanyl-D-alanine carboxypeptidase (penicillin-binding protein 5/6)
MKQILCALLITILSITNSFAAKKHANRKKKAKTYASYNNQNESYLVVDMNNYKVLYSENSQKKIYPASLTKMMTLYILFEEISKKRISFNSKFVASRSAELSRPSKLFLKNKDEISVISCIRALIIKSANDVAVTVAENIAGSEARFAYIMNKKAYELGMYDTYFKNASGWHHASQKTTALDLAKLALAIKRDFPQYYHFFKETEFYHKGKLINGHNKVTKFYKGAEGFKTGYTNAAGFNLVSAASRDNKSLLGIVTGQRSANIRDKKMISLLNAHFEKNKL